MNFLHLFRSQNEPPLFQKIKTLFSQQSKFTLIILIAFITALSTSLIFYQKYNTLQKLVKDPTLMNKEEAKKVISQVSKLINLPAGEDPTVATVSDLNQLKDKPFFKNAKLGDKVLIYTNAKKAFLYDPVANKIVDVGPITTEAQLSPSPAPSIAPSSVPAPTLSLENLKVMLYNGSQVVGATNKFEQELKTKLPQLTVVDKNIAKNRDYQETLLIDLDGNKTNQANLIAQILGIKVSTLPSAETASPSADFLVIVGKDKSK